MTTASLKRRSRLIGVTNKEVAFQLLKQKFGHVLCKGKGISYALRQLKIHNKNYTTQSGTMEQGNRIEKLELQRTYGTLCHTSRTSKYLVYPCMAILRTVAHSRVPQSKYSIHPGNKKVCDVAYKIKLHERLSIVHNTFHVANLKKCHADEPLAILLDGLHFDDKLQFVEEPIEIIDREVNRLKQSHIPLVKVRWNSKKGPEFTWEREDQFRKKYPHLFSKTGSSSSVTCVLKPEDRVVGELGWEARGAQEDALDLHLDSTLKDLCASLILGNDSSLCKLNNGEQGNATSELSLYSQIQGTTLQVYRHFELTSYYKAFEITADVPEIYMQEFWVTASRHHSSLRFKINGKSHTVNVDNVRDMLKICPKLSGQKFKDLPLKEEILSFIRELRHTCEIKYLSDVNVNHMHQPYRSFAAIINKCLSGKTNALESLRLSRAQILRGMYHNNNVDYVYLLWEDLVYQVENKNSKKNNYMYYP
ncbi:hypothetical protein Tco_0839209 [Tanacetum coccineum]|uniref:Tf2-1-like SH3-like domain-containing protein n=1 Tax=Tanacetum coccineum TaxID=301880 RepID=A0ABQ5AST6_9ASTR